MRAPAKFPGLLRSVLPIVLSTAAPIAANEVADHWRAIQSASLDPSRAVQVQGLEIEMELARLRLDRGLLVPARALGGLTTELVFVGEGSFHLAPPDDLERAQLELFTDRIELDVAIDRAVLVVTGQEVVERLLGRDPADADAEGATVAEEVYRGWVAGAERRGFGADVAILRSTLGDAPYREYFVAWCRSDEVGEFYYTFDPTEPEQITLGQFVPIETDDIEAHKRRRPTVRSSTTRARSSSACWRRCSGRSRSRECSGRWPKP